MISIYRKKTETETHQSLSTNINLLKAHDDATQLTVE